MGRKSLKDRAQVVLNPRAKDGYTVRIKRTVKEKIELSKRICDLYSTGKYTLESICERFGVQRVTFWQWARPDIEVVALIVKNEPIPIRCIPQVHEMYKEAAKKFKEQYIYQLQEQARKGLQQKILGNNYEEITEEMELDTDRESETYGEMVTKKRKVKKGKRDPDTQAIIFALTNVDPENFKNSKFVKQDTNINHSITGLESLTDEELAQKKRDLDARLIKLTKQQRNEDIEEAEVVSDDDTDEFEEDLEDEGGEDE